MTLCLNFGYINSLRVLVVLVHEVYTVPNPGYSEVGRKFGDLHHLRSVGKLLKDTQTQGKLFFCVGAGLALL